MDSTDTNVGHANSRVERTRDEARARRLHPPLRARLSRGLRGPTEQLEPDVARQYAGGQERKV